MAKVIGLEEQTHIYAKPPRRKKILILVGVLLAAGLIVFAVISLLPDKKDSGSPQAVDPNSIKPETPAEKSYAHQLDGNFAAAYQVLDEALDKAANDEERASLYNEKSIVAFNAKDFGFALEMARKSEELAPSISSAHIIASSAEELKNYDLAVEYLNKKIERLTAPGQNYLSEEIDSLRAKINQLEAL